MTAERAAEIAARRVARVQRGHGKGIAFDGFNQLDFQLRPPIFLIEV